MLAAMGGSLDSWSAAITLMIMEMTVMMLLCAVYQVIQVLYNYEYTYLKGTTFAVEKSIIIYSHYRKGYSQFPGNHLQCAGYVPFTVHVFYICGYDTLLQWC